MSIDSARLNAIKKDLGIFNDASFYELIIQDLGIYLYSLREKKGFSSYGIARRIHLSYDSLSFQTISEHYVSGFESGSKTLKRAIEANTNNPNKLIFELYLKSLNLEDTEKQKVNTKIERCKKAHKSGR